MMGVRPFEIALGAAVGLVALEVMTGTLVSLGFGVGCLAVAGVEAVSGDFQVGRDVRMFAVVAVLTIVFVRRVFARAGDSRRGKGDVNEY